MNIAGVTIIRRIMFNHDCDGCTHLGCAKVLKWERWDGPTLRDRDRHAVTKYFDLYLCKKCDGGSIVVRFGNDGPDYTSSMIAIIPQLIVVGENQRVHLGTQMLVVGMQLALLKMIEDKT